MSTHASASGSASPLHVLTLTPFYPTVSDDASGCFIAEPLQALAALGVKNTVVVAMPFYRKSEASHPNVTAAHIAKYLSIPSRWGLASAGALLHASTLSRMRALHRSAPIHIIHAHGPLPCGHAAMLLSRELGVPFVVSVHGLDAYGTRQVAGLPGEWCRRVTKQVFESAEKVLCISRHVEQRVLEGGAACQTAVVYNSADPALFAPVPRIAPADLELVVIGNLIPVKGHANVLRALAAVGAKYPTLSCVVIGDGRERAHLIALARELGVSQRVTFAGRKSRDEVANTLRTATLFVLPSTYEALGCVYLEAMASGTPAIGCTGQGIEEVIRQGSNGWLVAPDKLDDLVHALNTLLENPALREQIGRQARETILQGFTTDHQAARLLQIYSECVA